MKGINWLVGLGLVIFFSLPSPALLLFRNNSYNIAALAISPGSNDGIFNVLLYGAGTGVDDSSAIATAEAACIAAGGGRVDFPPIGKAYIIKTVNAITLGNGCIWHGYSHSNWKSTNVPFDNVEADYTSFGSWIRCDGTSTTCLNITGTGAGIEGINFWQTQPTPTVTSACSSPCTFTNGWTPNAYKFVITISPGSNFWSLRDLNFINATNCIDVEGPTSGVAGIWGSIKDSSLGCANTGIKFKNIDNTLLLSNLHHEMWWYQGSSDWFGYLEGSGNHVDWDVCYLANPQISNVEFSFTGVAIKFTDCSVVNGFGTVTFAANNMQMSNISFNEVCTAMEVANSTTHVTGTISGMILAADTTTSGVSGQCQNQSGATNALNFPIRLNSDNANMFFNGAQVSFTQGLALVGGGNVGTVHGQVHFSQFVVSNYSAFQNNTPLLLTDSTGSIADANGLDDVFNAGVFTPGVKCSGTCVQKMPYNDIAANLTTCSASSVGAEMYVTDLASAPSYLATLTTGSGGATSRALAICNGTNWTAH